MDLDRQKTKIIATLGDPERLVETAGGTVPASTYEHGVTLLSFDYERDPTLEDIVGEFFEAGADVLRVNLAHIKLEDVAPKFRALKRAIFKAEEKFKRKVGMLADLPGPKIRFDSSNWILPRDELELSFARLAKDQSTTHDAPPAGDPVCRPKSTVAQINIDDVPFLEADPTATDTILRGVETRRRALKRKGRKLLAFIGDNDATLEVKSVDLRRHAMRCHVISPGPEVTERSRLVAGGHKGFTIRGIIKPIPALTDQDRAKLDAIISADWEPLDGQQERILSHVGISFCQNRDDVRQVMEQVVRKVHEIRNPSEPFPPDLDENRLDEILHDSPLLVAKIETQAGVDNIDEILDLVDGVMIARGDLALEIETAELPRRTKQIMRSCNLRGKPVIVATQMLESMRDNLECSRPEATDVFDAVLSNADALMLSGETSSGRYPGHAIWKMRELARQAEIHHGDRNHGQDRVSEDLQLLEYFHHLESITERVDKWQGRWEAISTWYHHQFFAEGNLTRGEYDFMLAVAKMKDRRLKRQHSTDRVTHAACLMAVDDVVSAIVAPTASGRTARMLSRFRPRVWILAQPHSLLTARRLTMVRGVLTGCSTLRVDRGSDDVAGLMRRSSKDAEKHLGSKTVVFTCGTPLGEIGSTNLIQRWELGS